MAAGLALLAAPSRPGAQGAPEEITIAFIGDQGLGANSRAVLELIRDEGADAVVHSGDFDYSANPSAWDAMISGILGQDMPYFASPGNHDWLNNGAGAMRELARELGVATERAGRGLLSLDYDADGDLDLFIANHGSRPELYRNDVGNRNGWLRVVAVGSTSNRDGIGAVVRVFDGPGPPQLRQINAGSHFLGQSEFTAHFGLGAGADPVERVEVFWPASGRTNVLRSPPRNATLTVLEPGAPPSGGGCGLLGLEPCLLLLAWLIWRRRRLAG